MSTRLTLLGLVLVPVLSTSALASDPSFSNQTASIGVTATHQPLYFHSFLAGGVVGDFNADGWQDIYVPVGGGAPDELYINDGDGTFTERAAEWGIASLHRGTAAAVGDYDGDGWVDLYVTSLGPVAGDQVGHHRLYRNVNGTGFVDVAAAAGVNQSSSSTPDGWGAAWGDFDLDGDLDLAVAGWSSNNGNRLFENEGDGTFTDVTSSAGLGTVNPVNGFAPRFVDMNGDRYPEIIWIGDFGTSKYFKNNQDGTFTDWTILSGTALAGTEMGSTVADWDEDGDFDFYVSTIADNKLYRNDGGDTYTDIAGATGTGNTGWGWGTIAVDYDHDSLVDIVTTTQSARQYAFRNTMTGSNLTFVEEALTIGLNTAANGRGVANFDYDNDGDQDIVFFPNQGSIEIFRNDVSGTDMNWLRVFLDRGCALDVAPHGIGSVVKLTTGSRTVMGRIDGGSNYLSQSEMSAHFGLGATTVIDEVRIEWTNGDVTVLTNVAANQTLTVSKTSYSYCDALPNSTGSPARISSAGSPSLALNNLVLRAQPGPVGEPGIFYFGPNEIQSSFGEGLRCVGGSSGTVKRLFPFAAFDAGGQMSYAVDATNQSSLTAGSTWKFQGWYRDPQGGPSGFNLSDGLSVTFCP